MTHRIIISQNATIFKKQNNHTDCMPEDTEKGLESTIISFPSKLTFEDFQRVRSRLNDLPEIRIATCRGIFSCEESYYPCDQGRYTQLKKLNLVCQEDLPNLDFTLYSNWREGQWVYNWMELAGSRTVGELEELGMAGVMLSVKGVFDQYLEEKSSQQSLPI